MITATGSGNEAIINDYNNGIAFDSGRLFRYGRMRIENTNGSELLNLSLHLANVAFRRYAGGINANNMPVAHDLRRLQKWLGDLYAGNVLMY